MNYGPLHLTKLRAWVLGLMQILAHRKYTPRMSYIKLEASYYNHPFKNCANVHFLHDVITHMPRVLFCAFIRFNLHFNDGHLLENTPCLQSIFACTLSNTIEFQSISFVLKKNHILIFLGHTYKTEKQRTESRFKQRGKTDRKDREFINKERKADNIRTTADVVLPLRSGKK